MSDAPKAAGLPRSFVAAVVVIGLFAGGAILHSAEAVLAPMVLALVTGVVLSPIAVPWERIGIPHRFGVLINLAVALMAIGGIVLLLQPVAMRLAEQAPKVVADVEDTLRDVRAMLRGLSQMSRDVADAMTLEEAPAGPPGQNGAEPAAEGPSVADALWLAPQVLAKVAVFAGTLFFFMATRQEIYRWLALNVTWARRPRDIQARLLRAETRVSRYFLTIAAINAGLGLAVFALMRQMGVPGAPVWGLLAFLANFVLYLGPASFAVALLYAGVATFDGAMALLPSAAFVGLNFIEGQFVTPALVGRQMQLNPLVVFLSVVFGIWLWGPIGGIVAIPILVWLVVLNESVPQAAPAPKQADQRLK